MEIGLELDAFLKAHGIDLEYGFEDLEREQTGLDLLLKNDRLFPTHHCSITRLSLIVRTFHRFYSNTSFLARGIFKRFYLF